jgi:hypothetical protein
MPYSEYDIIRFNFPMEHAVYPRPCVVIGVKSDGVLTIVPISTKNYGIEDKFQIHADDPDFKATGLDDTSYVYGHPVLNIPPSTVLKRLGAISGKLKERFLKWNG